MRENNNCSIAMIGGGPAALLLLKNMLDYAFLPDKIYVFEKSNRFGTGMPYSKYGSGKEHVANVSANELPNFTIDFETYIRDHPTSDYPDFVSDGSVNPYQVIPRLLLGDYLEFQFDWYIHQLREKDVEMICKKNCPVKDIVRAKEPMLYHIITENDNVFLASTIILCTGHTWPKKNEGTVKNWYDSPYPPSKFVGPNNFSVAIRGTSLTAIDAVKTLARLNGHFEYVDKDHLKYQLNPESEKFRIDLFSTGGFLPALRFHSEGEAYSNDWIMSLPEIYEYKRQHGGFVDLDYVFEINFKKPLKKKDPAFYNQIKDLSIEAFVEKMLSIRKELDSFDLFEAEYKEAEKSIDRHKPISWKEALAAFSYAMNYPAKHFSAEDMLRLRKTLLPLISIIIASLPQGSYKELMALYDAGIIDLIQVDKESHVEPGTDGGGIYHYQSPDKKPIEKYYPMFVDAIGQQPMDLADLNFDGLKEDQLVSTAYLNFKDNQNAEELLKEDTDDPIFRSFQDQYSLRVHGLEINDYFQSLNNYGAIIDSLYIMAVPFIGGLNPDYSGLDFCDTAAERIVNSLLSKKSRIMNFTD